MKKDSKINFVFFGFILVTLVVASIEFVSLSSKIKIDSKSFVASAKNIYIYFSSSNKTQEESEIKGIANFEGAKAHSAVINNNSVDAVVSNMSATFDKSNQSYTYSFYIHNTWQWPAYLKSVKLSSVANPNDVERNYIRCSFNMDSEDITKEILNEACSNVNVTLEVGNTTLVPNRVNNKLDHELNSYEFENIVVTISYEGDTLETPMDVIIGDLNVNYDSKDHKVVRTTIYGECPGASLGNIADFKNCNTTSQNKTKTYMYFDVEDSVVTSVTICDNTDSICLSSDGTKETYALAKSKMYEFFGGNETNIPKECDKAGSGDSEEIYCVSDTYMLAASADGTILVNQYDEGSCIVSPQTGVYSC